MQSTTPYEHKLRAMARELCRAGDKATCDLLCTMIAHVQQGRYGALPELFRRISPVYCVRLGDPPESREKDVEESHRSPRAPRVSVARRSQS
jgi:hypothetical protein